MVYSSRLPRNVYILGDGSLFDEIMAHMLTSETKLRVIKRIYFDDASFLTDIIWCQPDVILLNETDQFPGERILALLAQVSLTANLRVMIMGLNNNVIRIYDQSADQLNNHRWGRVPFILTEVNGWGELFELVRGKQLLEVAGW